MAIVKYDNSVNEISGLTGFGSDGLSLLMAIFSEMKDCGTKPKTFTYYQLKKNAQMENYSTAMMTARLKDIVNILIGLHYSQESEEDNIYEVFSVFQSFTIDGKRKTLTVEVSEKFKFILNGFRAEMTEYELAEYLKLTSAYAKVLFQILSQYKAKGYVWLGIDKIKRIFDPPKSYSFKALNAKIIKPAVTQCSSYFTGLKVIQRTDGIPKKLGGGRVIALKFVFNPKAQESTKRNNKKALCASSLQFNSDEEESVRAMIRAQRPDIYLSENPTAE